MRNAGLTEKRNFASITPETASPIRIIENDHRRMRPTPG